MIGKGELILIIIFLLVLVLPIYILFRLLKFFNKSEELIDKYMKKLDEEEKS